MHEDFSDLVSMWERTTTRYAERPLFGETRASGWVWKTYAEVAEQVVEPAEEFHSNAPVGRCRGDGQDLASAWYLSGTPSVISFET